MARALVFSHNKGNRVEFTKLLFQKVFTHCAMVLPFIGSLNTAIVLNQVNGEASKRIAYVIQRLASFRN